MKLLKSKFLILLTFLMFFTNCDTENVELNTIEQNDISFTDINDVIQYQINFWKSNPDPTEEQLDEMYARIDAFLEMEEFKPMDYSILFAPRNQDKNSIAFIAGEAASWAIGKGLDKLFSDDDGGTTPTVSPQQLNQAVTRIQGFINTSTAEILDAISDIPEKTATLVAINEGKSLVDSGISSLLKGENSDFKDARDDFSEALADFRLALPESINLFVPTFAYLAEANRQLATSTDKFAKNMNRVQIEAMLSFTAILNFPNGNDDREVAIAVAGGRNNYDALVTAINFQASVFLRGRKLPKSGTVFLNNIRSLNGGGFLLTPSNEFYNDPGATNLFDISYLSKNELKETKNFGAVLRSENQENIFKLTPTTEFDPTPFRYFFAENRSVNSEDYNIFFAPIFQDQYLLITNTNFINENRTLLNFGQLWGVGPVVRDGEGSLNYVIALIDIFNKKGTKRIK